MIKAKNYVLPFVSKKKIATDTYTFSFKKPAEFTFLPGQYNRWTLPFTIKDGRGSSRFFTISSTPSDKKIISFTTKIGKSDFKKKLLKLTKKDTITIFGPMGVFTFEDDDVRGKIFVSGGIGITPFYSYIKNSIEKDSITPITLFVSFSKMDTLIFYNELKKIEKKYSNIHIIYTITQHILNSEIWNDEKGKITKSMIEKYTQKEHDKVFYIVGSPQMVEEMYTLLTKMDIAPEQIKTEQFTGY